MPIAIYEIQVSFLSERMHTGPSQKLTRGSLRSYPLKGILSQSRGAGLNRVCLLQAHNYHQYLRDNKMTWGSGFVRDSTAVSQ